LEHLANLAANRIQNGHIGRFGFRDSGKGHPAGRPDPYAAGWRGSAVGRRLSSWPATWGGSSDQAVFLSEGLSCARATIPELLRVRPRRLRLGGRPGVQSAHSPPRVIAVQLPPCRTPRTGSAHHGAPMSRL
jgi:hypothetical protein